MVMRDSVSSENSKIDIEDYNAPLFSADISFAATVIASGDCGTGLTWKLDDAGKLKSIKPRHGRFAYVWFEEFSELNGVNQVRSVLQSVVRGGDGFRIFNSFNPPISRANWANKYVLISAG